MEIDFDEARRRLRWFWWDYKPLIVAFGIVAGVTILALFIWLIVDNVNASTVARRVTEAETLFTTASTRVEDAAKTYDARRLDFPAKYSDGIPNALSQARKCINQFFEPQVGLLARLHDAQAKRDWKTAYSLLDQIDLQQGQELGVVDRILGPPDTQKQGLYDLLDAKVAAIDAGLAATVTREVDDAQKHISNKGATYLCGSSDHLLSFVSADGQIKSARDSLKRADSTLADLETWGVVDKPLVYDQILEARGYAQQAKTTADGLVSSAGNANLEIASCTSNISSAESYLLVNTYRWVQASGELTKAKTARDEAYQACYTQNFTLVSAKVNSCVSLAQSAIWYATEPTATPTPRPTSTPEPPKPVIIIDTSSSGDDDNDSDYDLFEDDSNDYDLFEDDSNDYDLFDDSSNDYDLFEDSSNDYDLFEDSSNDYGLFDE